MGAFPSDRTRGKKAPKDKLHTSQRSKRTLLIALQMKEGPFKGLQIPECGGINSDPNVPYVNLKDCQEWAHFDSEMAENIRNLFGDPEVARVLNRDFKKAEEDSFQWTVNTNATLRSEQCIERLWCKISTKLNVIQEIVANELDKLPDGRYIHIDDGSHAKRQAREHASTTTKPDLAGYLLIPETKRDPQEPEFIDNRVPGDVKCEWKIRREMLPPYPKSLTPKLLGIWSKEAEKVLSQIHYYMDKHEARYGYIVTNKTCIFFRRRGTGWGHIDISPAIPHDREGNGEQGIFNSKMVLFYLHRVVANDEKHWKLESGWSTIRKRSSPRLNTQSKSRSLAVAPKAITTTTVHVDVSVQSKSGSNGLDKIQEIDVRVKASNRK